MHSGWVYDAEPACPTQTGNLDGGIGRAEHCLVVLRSPKAILNHKILDFSIPDYTR